MNTLVKKMVTKTTTENGMVTNTTSGSNCLDLFFIGGACRTLNANEIKSLFGRALSENFDLTVKIMAYLRDVREGVGERSFFRHFLNYLVENNMQDKINFEYIPEIGRWDDLFSLFGNKKSNAQVAEIFRNALLEKKNGLCAKWTPRKGEISTFLRTYFKMSPKEFRKLVVSLTNVVETKMCANQWSIIEYSHVPSIANIKYNSAFLRHDEVRRRDFLSKASKGEVKINSSVAMPHEIVKLCLTKTVAEEGTMHIRDNVSLAKHVVRNDTALAMWNQLPDLMKDNTFRILPVADTSGSMRGMPFLISLGLSLYISERNKGAFHNAFITFSKRPQIQYLEGNLFDRLSQFIAQHPANTDLEATFEEILRVATKHRISEDEMPTHILIISDMEFDRACRKNESAIKMIKNKYKTAGYNMPDIIFWNVNARSTKNIPVSMSKEGTALISGASQNALKAVLSGVFTPYKVMENAVNIERYEKLLNK